MASRRGNGEGSVFRRKDGRWEGQLTTGYDQHGRRRRRSYFGETKLEVLEKMGKAKLEVAAGTYAPPSKLTVGAFLDQWHRDVVVPNRSPKTAYNYGRTLELYLKPSLGGHRLDRLNAAQVEGMLAEMSRAGKSPRNRQLTLATLTAALNQAVQWGILRENPCKRVTKPKVAKKRPVFWTPEELSRFLAAARGERLEALFVVAATTGMRLGEILGLRWVDVDLRQGEINVRQQLSEFGGRLEFRRPKTDSGDRLIPVPDSTISALRRHRERLVAEGLAACQIVFPTRAGTPHGQSNLTRRAFARITKAAGVPKIKFHGIRHSYLTLLLANGVDVKTVQELAGHSDPMVTLTTYTHVLPNAKRAAADRASGLLFGS